jgi:hypothetical protein
MTGGRVRARIGSLFVAIVLAALVTAVQLHAQDPAPRDTVQVPPDDDPRRPQPPPRPDMSAAEHVLSGLGRLLRKPFEMVGTALEGTLIPIEEERGGFAAGLSAATPQRERSHLSYSGGSIGTRSGFLGGGVKYDAIPEEEGPQLGFTGAVTNRGYQEYTVFAGWNDPRERPYARVTGYYDIDTMNEYWGIGPDSDKDREATWSWEKYGGVAAVGLPQRRGIWGSAWVTYERTSVFDGYVVGEPDLDDLFPDDVFPELELWGPGANVAIDLRDSRGYPKSGILLTGNAELWRSLGDEEADWFRYGAELSGHLPLGSHWHILSAKAGVDVAEPEEAGGSIPFPYLPALGGSQSLRGFSSWRFRDRAAMYGTAELRWRIWLEHAQDPEKAGAIEAALFYDVGQVGPKLEDLDFADREETYGVLARFYVAGGHLMTAGVGFSDEATKFVFTTNNSW